MYKIEETICVMDYVIRFLTFQVDYFAIEFGCN